MSTITTQLRQPRAGERATADEFYDMDDAAGFELVDGVIVEKNVSIDSCDIGQVVSTIFGIYMLEHGNIRSYSSEMGFQCFDHPNTIRKPDVSVVAINRVRELPDKLAGYMPIVPDLAVEVMSKNDRRNEMLDKVADYHDAGFPLVWVFFPRQRQLEVHPLGGDMLTLTGEDTVPAPPCMPGFSAKVADFFAGVPTD
ncbi:MAG: Uma2 family endonuclease [Planctomycetota bacterium]